MAKALAYRRDTQQVVTVDTINNNITDLANAIVGADVAATFPFRTRNNLTVFQGDPYMLYRHSTNELRLSKLSAGVWADVGGFGPILPGAGAIQPVGLHVVQGTLVAVWSITGGAPFDGFFGAVSADGAVWSVTASRLTPTQPTAHNGGHSMQWREAIWVANADGITYYDPLNGPPQGQWAPGFDTGDDAGLVGANMQIGNFAFWNNDLYFVRPDSATKLYRLDGNWQVGTATAPPAWTNQGALSIPTLGTFTVGPDSGAVLLFVNRLDELCLLYSAQLSTKLIRTTAAAYPTFTDISGDFLPPELVAAKNLGFALFQDDRRRGTNELQSFLIRFPSAGDTQLASWDAVNFFKVRNTFVGVNLMPPDERFAALRTHTAIQPTTHIPVGGVTAPFPGRTSISYVVRDASSRPVDVFGEFSIDGDEWSPMSQGDGDSGDEQLATSPAGLPYTFFWDSFQDLDGVFPNMNMRIVARISGV